MKKKEAYKKYHIKEMIYCGEELEYFVVIMRDDTIFRFDSIDEFIKWYKEL